MPDLVKMAWLVRMSLSASLLSGLDTGFNIKIILINLSNFNFSSKKEINVIVNVRIPVIFPATETLKKLKNVP